ncbi:MAG: hypothetical protein EDS66_05755 [Planctomycetota bacterium]|nr:MAG: hypothetical protein EDS66_05755 [Planctomycetota bacterium]MCQ3919568.1 hypothetical protein [Planctomycetota bacterium]
MKPLRIYIDTSVGGGCFDPEFAEVSRALIEAARSGVVSLLVSDLLIREVRARREMFPPCSRACLVNPLSR